MTECSGEQLAFHGVGQGVFVARLDGRALREDRRQPSGFGAVLAKYVIAAAPKLCAADQGASRA